MVWEAHVFLIYAGRQSFCCGWTIDSSHLIIAVTLDGPFWVNCIKHIRQD